MNDKHDPKNGQFAASAGSGNSAEPAAAMSQHPKDVFRAARRDAERLHGVVDTSAHLTGQNGVRVADIRAELQNAVEAHDLTDLKDALKRAHKIAGTIDATGHGDNIQRGIRDVFKKNGLRIPGNM